MLGEEVATRWSAAVVFVLPIAKKVESKKCEVGLLTIGIGIGGVTLTLLLLHSLQDGKYDLLVS